MTTCASACATVSIDKHGTNNLCCGQTDPDLNYAEMGNFPLKGWKGKSKPKDFTAHHYVYTENRSKNHSEAFCQLRVENKVVPIFAQSECGDRCHVHLLDLYFSKLPSKAYEMEFSIYTYIADNSTHRSTEAMVFKCAIWRK